MYLYVVTFGFFRECWILFFNVLLGFYVCVLDVKGLGIGNDLEWHVVS